MDVPSAETDGGIVGSRTSTTSPRRQVPLAPPWRAILQRPRTHRRPAAMSRDAMSRDLLLAGPENVPLLSQALTLRRKDREHVLRRFAELEGAVAEIEEEVQQAERMLWAFREALTSDAAEQLR